MATLGLNITELLEGIPAGAWVAISERQRKAIAFGTDARAVLNAARRMGERLPLMLRVPETVQAMAA
jgi:hypothetical protein